MMLGLGNSSTVFWDVIFRRLADGDTEKYYNMVFLSTIAGAVIGFILFALVVRFLIVVPSECKRKADALESIEESLIIISEQNKNKKEKEIIK